jgi:hypothetical protein
MFWIKRREVTLSWPLLQQNKHKNLVSNGASFAEKTRLIVSFLTLAAFFL